MCNNHVKFFFNNELCYAVETEEKNIFMTVTWKRKGWDSWNCSQTCGNFSFILLHEFVSNIRHDDFLQSIFLSFVTLRAPPPCILKKTPCSKTNLFKGTLPQNILICKNGHIYHALKKIILKNKKLYFQLLFGPWNYFSSSCAEWSVPGSLPCLEHGLHCSLSCAEQRSAW